MHWQDVVFTGTYIIFNAALIPSLKSKHKPAVSTSIMTGCCSLVITFTQMSLNFYLAALSAFINGVLWLTLAYQKSHSH